MHINSISPLTSITSPSIGVPTAVSTVQLASNNGSSSVLGTSNSITSNIIFWNARSLFADSRLPSIKSFLTSPSRPLILCISEPWVKRNNQRIGKSNKTVNDLLKIPGYNLTLPDQFSTNRNLTRSLCTGIGGLAFYTSNTLLSPTLLPESTVCVSTPTQVAWIEIFVPSRLIIGVAYIHMYATDSELSVISQSVHDVVDHYPDVPIVLGGDFNAHVRNWGGDRMNSHGQWLENLIGQL